MNVTQVIQRLRSEQRDLDQQIKSIKERKAQIDTTISVLLSMDAAPDRVTHLVRTDQSQSVEERDDLVVAPHHGRDAGPQATLRRLMRARPGEEFDSKAAHDLLIEEGWESKSKDPVNVVRTALAALANQGEVVKRGRGKYVFDPAQQEQAIEPESSEPPSSLAELDLPPSGYTSGSYASETLVGPQNDTNAAQSTLMYGDHR